MAILVDQSSRFIIQGITGGVGRSFAGRMVGNGTPIVGGVTPGKGGAKVSGLPVFNSVQEAVRRTGANASLISVPPPAVKDAFIEAMMAGIKFVWTYTENVPVQDVTVMVALAKQYGARLLGANAAGVVSPGKANFSDLNDENLKPGRVGVVSKSGTLAGEVIDGLMPTPYGESTVVMIGGDPIIGLRYDDILRLFAEDDETDAIVLIGEIGGSAEIEGARTWQELGCDKPLIVFIAGQSAPPGKRMGHAGAIVSRSGETAADKIQAFEQVGARIARLITDAPGLVVEALEARTGSAVR